MIIFLIFYGFGVTKTCTHCNLFENLLQSYIKLRIINILHIIYEMFLFNVR